MRTVTLAALAPLLFCATAVRAQEPVPPAETEAVAAGEGLPLPWAQRPLTLPQQMVRIDGGLFFQALPDFYDPVRFETVEVDPIVLFYVGGAYGIIDDFEVGTIILPLQFSPRVRYANPMVYATFRFLEGRAELGATVRVTFPAIRNTPAFIDPGLLLLLHVGDSARLDVAAFQRIRVEDEDVYADLLVPVSFAFNVIPELYVGAASGLILPEYDSDFWAIPLEGFAGYTIGGETGLADLEVRSGWERLFTPTQAEEVNGLPWHLHFLARVYLDL